MKILVTGSNGLLGQKILAQGIGEPQLELIGCSQGKDRIESFSGYEYYELDITDRSAVLDLIKRTRPDVVINTAAMTNVDACESDKEGCWKVNVDAVDYLIEACRPVDAHLIHLSTDFVFNGEDGPYNETDRPDPLSFYGKSKLASEELVINSGLRNWAIARTIIVYGIADNMSRTNVVLWAKGALEKGETIRVVDDQFRSPTLAEDLAAGCLLIANKHANGIFHLSGKDTMSILELVYRVADHFGFDKNIVESIKTDSLGQEAARPPITGFILDKSRNELGYIPHSFEEGLSILNEQLKAIS